MPENAIAYDGPISRIGTPRRIAAVIHAAIRGAPGKNIEPMQPCNGP